MPYYWFFRLNLKYLGWPYRVYIRTAKNCGFCEELLNANDFEAILTTLCCHDYGAKTSEAVQKITTDQKDYHKCSSCVIICWIAKIYQSITDNFLCTFLSQTLYTLVKRSKLKCKFLRLSSARVKICQIPHVNFEMASQFLFKFFIIFQCHCT